jgi:formylglycine-generating enzyme required for sulfatase activity
MMKKTFILFVLAFLPFLVMGQIEPLCPVCKKVISKCQYKGKHPKPQPESQCPTCKNVISKCQYKGKHPKPEAAGYDVTFSSNVPSAAMSIDGVASDTASGTRFLKTGSHTVCLTASGYEDLSQTITVNSSSRTFSLTMKKKENSLSPVLQNLISNMVCVEGGTFTMGASSEQGSDAYSDEKPVHQVTLSSFSIGKYEVTQEEWETVMGSNPSKFKGAKRPVECVSWDDCQDFIRKLDALTDKRFRLPTEAEWEYAARGGNRSQGYKYVGGNSIGSVAWYTDNSGKETLPVGQKLSNELGLYDMAGNVWEWCQDWYDGSYYGKSPSTNPVNNTSASNRVNRGGSWYNGAWSCRVSNRGSDSPDDRGSDLGLRLAL